LPCSAVEVAYGRDPGVAHHLLFSYKHSGMGEATDGVVTVVSHLRPAAQQGALRVEGFNETHMGVLEAKEVSARVNELLGRVSDR
jgi:hypothetical protein